MFKKPKCLGSKMNWRYRLIGGMLVVLLLVVDFSCGSSELEDLEQDGVTWAGLNNATGELKWFKV